jgi:hypothetical protein
MNIRENRESRMLHNEQALHAGERILGARHTGCTKFFTATWRLLIAFVYTDTLSDDYYSWGEFGRTLVHEVLGYIAFENSRVFFEAVSFSVP